MKTLRGLALFLLTPALTLLAVDRLTVNVTNDLPDARPSETITVPWSEVSKGGSNAANSWLDGRCAYRA